MSLYVCIKEIPHLCNVGEKGTIIEDTVTTVREIVDDIHPRGWGFVSITSKKYLKFTFNSTFNEPHVLLCLGKHIILKEHFKKVLK
jgi:hypothetical protein